MVECKQAKDMKLGERLKKLVSLRYFPSGFSSSAQFWEVVGRVCSFFFFFLFSFLFSGSYFSFFFFSFFLFSFFSFLFF